MRFRLGDFPAEIGWARRVRIGLWRAVSATVFEPWFVPRRLRPPLLRLFGAQLGSGCVIREHVRIHDPRFLRCDDYVWIGAGVVVVNHTLVTISHDVCISQQAFICSSGHDRGSRDFRFRHSPVTVGAHSWVAARALLLPGDAVPEGTFVPAGTRFRDIHGVKHQRGEWE